MADESDPRAPSKVVTVSAMPVGGGTVSGGGTFPQGTQVTVSAVAGGSYDFVNWADALSGQEYSTASSYVFVATDVGLQANFILSEDASCGSCRYGREPPASARVGDGRLACCRGAPALSVMDARQLMPAQHERLAWWVWPLVEADWWCGEHEAR